MADSSTAPAWNPRLILGPVELRTIDRRVQRFGCDLGDFYALRESHDALQEKANRLQSAGDKYRRLRMHVRKDGTAKSGLPKERAEAEAVRLTEKFGRPYEAYGCWCGRMHVGHLRTASDRPRVNLESNGEGAES